MWFHDTNRRLHLDFHVPEWDTEILKDFDAEQIVENVVKSKSQALYFFAKCHYGNAYYDTKIGHKHKNMGDRDFLREIVDECKKSDIPVIAYYSMVWDNFAAINHPEWTMRDPEGRSVRTGGWSYMCFNSPYLNYAKKMIGELVENYPIKGIHFDMMNFNFDGLSCYCDNCRKLFYQKTGRTIPESATWDETWRRFLEFRSETVLCFAGELKKAAHDINPEIGTVFNYHGSPGFDWRVGQMPVKHAALGSQVTGESYPPAFGIVYTSMESRFLRGLVYGNVSEIVNSRFNYSYDYTIKPVNQLKWELLTGLANGAGVMVVDQVLHNGRVDPILYDRLGEIFSEVEEKSELWGGTPVKHVGLYYSAKTRDYYARGDLPRYLLSFTGAFRALMESHLPVDILLDETCTLQKLMEYKVIFLANTACMDEAEASMFKEYVKQGGILVSTLDTALYDENGSIRDDYVLADVFGAGYDKKVPTRNHYIRMNHARLGEGIHPEEFVLCVGQGNMVKLREGTGIGSVFMSFHDREGLYQTFSHGMTSPYKEKGPAVVVNKYGKGMSVYTPASVCSNYADLFNHPIHRLLMKNMVLLNSVPDFDVRAPLNVEVVINEQREKNRLIVHLIGYNAKKQVVTLQSNISERPIVPPASMEEPLLYRASIRLPFNDARVSSFSDTTRLERQENTVNITCSEVHEAIIIDY